jgi:hypothetical protein
VIQTAAVLLGFHCRREKERLEEIVRKARIIASFQWPEESLEFEKAVRVKVERLRYERNA